MSAVPAAATNDALPALAPKTQRRQAPLRAVDIGASRDQRRARPRLVAAIVTVGGLFVILAAQLLLTIATSEGAYEISSLQTAQGELARDEQVLVEQLQVLDSPQHLAAEAQGMGMVASSSTAYLRLADNAVLGAPVVASASSALRTAADGTSLIPNTLLSAVPLVGAIVPTPDAAGVRDSAGGSGAPSTTLAEGSVASTSPVGIPSPNTH